jgi:hypothetical protein
MTTCHVDESSNSSIQSIQSLDIILGYSSDDDFRIINPRNWFKRRKVIRNDEHESGGNIQNKDLEKIKTVFQNKEAQNALTLLYTQSQSECMRRGVCGMEIGLSRERDQVAVLKMFLSDDINFDIDNKRPEDFIVGNSKVSIKHCSGKVGKRIKIKWTSSEKSVKSAIDQIINAEDSYYPNLIITYIDIKHRKCTILCVSSDENKKIIKTLKRDAFHIPNGNSRGIEYSNEAMSELLNRVYFKIEINDFDFMNGPGLNPIERRIRVIKESGLVIPSLLCQVSSRSF